MVCFRSCNNFQIFFWELQHMQFHYKYFFQDTYFTFNCWHWNLFVVLSSLGDFFIINQSSYFPFMSCLFEGYYTWKSNIENLVSVVISLDTFQIFWWILILFFLVLSGSLPWILFFCVCFSSHLWCLTSCRYFVF